MSMFCCGFVIYDSCSVLFFCITSLVNSRVCVRCYTLWVCYMLMAVSVSALG